MPLGDHRFSHGLGHETSWRMAIRELVKKSTTEPLGASRSKDFRDHRASKSTALNSTDLMKLFGAEISRIAVSQRAQSTDTWSSASKGLMDYDVI